jgi:DNA modification methylase
MLAKAFTEWSLKNVYDYETHIRIGEALEVRGALPSTFMSLAPGAHDAFTWHDVNRMRTLNGDQTKKGLENHICPLQFDIVDRLIKRFSNEGDLIFDPFGGLFTVPYRALKLRRRGRASELNPGYFLDGIKYLQAMEREVSTPTMFDIFDRGEVAA